MLIVIFVVIITIGVYLKHLITILSNTVLIMILSMLLKKYCCFYWKNGE